MNNGRIAQATWLALAWPLALISAIVHLFIGLNNDTATLTHQAAKWLAGGAPYIDFMDTNPPLIIWLLAPVVRLSQITGMPVFVALNLAALLVGALSILLCERLLKPLQAASRASVLAALSVGLFGLSFLHQVFADREYLVVAMLLPFLVYCSPLAEREGISRALRLSCILFAALGVAIKPYTAFFCLFALGAKLFSARDTHPRLWMMEVFAWGACAILYMLVIALFAPAFFSEFLPLAVTTYSAITWSWDSKIYTLVHTLISSYALPAFVLLFSCFYFCRPRLDSLSCYALGLVLMAAVSYLASAGWYYTHYPFLLFSFLLLAVQAARLLGAARSSWLGKLMLWSSIALAAGLFFSQCIAPLSKQIRYDTGGMLLMQKPFLRTALPPATRAALIPILQKQPRFMWLGFALWAPAVLREDPSLHNVGRFDYLWPIPGILALGNNTREQSLLKNTLSNMLAEDIERRRPQLIVMDASPEQYRLPNDFSVLKFLMPHARLAEALAEYTLTVQINRCTPTSRNNCAYDIYQHNVP